MNKAYIANKIQNTQIHEVNIEANVLNVFNNTRVNNLKHCDGDIVIIS